MMAGGRRGAGWRYGVQSAQDERSEPLHDLLRDAERRPERGGDPRAKACLEQDGRIEIESIEKVLDVHAGVGVALDAQPALEEQRIGIFETRRQAHELCNVPADGNVSGPAAGGLYAPAADQEVQFEHRGADYAHRDAAPIELAKLVIEALVACDAVEGERNGRGEKGVGRAQEGPALRSVSGGHGRFSGHGADRGTTPCRPSCPSCIDLSQAGALRRSP